MDVRSRRWERSSYCRWDWAKICGGTKRPNLDIRCLDIVTAEVGRKLASILYTRFVLMHIRAREAAFSIWYGPWSLGMAAGGRTDFATAISTGENGADAQVVARVLRQLDICICQSELIHSWVTAVIFQTLICKEIDAKKQKLYWGVDRLTGQSGAAVEHLKQRLIDVGPSEDDSINSIHLMMINTWALATVAAKKRATFRSPQNQQNFTAGHSLTVKLARQYIPWQQDVTSLFRWQLFWG